MKSFSTYLSERKKSKKLKEDAVIAAGDAGTGNTGLTAVAASADSDIVQNDTDDDSDDYGAKTGANDVLGKYKKGQGVFGKDDFHLPDMLFKYDRFAGASAYAKGKKKKKQGYANQVFAKELKKIFENWNPDLDDKEKNEWGEEWQLLDHRHFLYHVIEEICDDCMLDPQGDHDVDSIYLYDIHYVINAGHYIVHLHGGMNGGQVREKLVKYFSLVKKFAKKLLSNDDIIESVWLIDFCNDCCDDVWDLRLGVSLKPDECDKPPV